MTDRTKGSLIFIGLCGIATLTVGPIGPLIVLLLVYLLPR